MDSLVSSSALIKAIKDQTSQLPPDFVYVIDIVSIRFGGYFTPEIRTELQRYRNLQMLTLNDCGILSLQNFPILPNLIRLDLVFNEIKGEDLVYLKYSRHLQTIMLGANKIEKIEDILHLKQMRNLLQLDLINNPLFRQPGYREKIFQIFPSLVILDTRDKSGKDAYDNVTMLQAVHRIPDHLFVHGQENNSFIHLEQKSNLSRALSRTGSLQIAISSKAYGRRQSKKHRVQSKKKFHPNKNKQIKRFGDSQYEAVFPRGKIRRMLKQKQTSIKISSKSAVYISSILEYITVEFLLQVGQETKNQRRHRITPLIIKQYLQGNQENQITKLWKSAILGTMGE